MKIFLKILNRFFVFLGVIFFVIIIALSYLWVKDPFGIKDLVNIKDLSSSSLNNIDIGNIDVNNFNLDSDKESCLIEKLGENRFREIMEEGEEPGFNDLLKAGPCLN